MKKLLLLLAIAAISCKKETVKTECDKLTEKGTLTLLRYSENFFAPKDTTGAASSHFRDSSAILLGAYGIFNDTSGKFSVDLVNANNFYSIKDCSTMNFSFADGYSVSLPIIEINANQIVLKDGSKTYYIFKTP